MQRTQLLCTFTLKTKIDETVEEIQNTYTVAFNKVYVLENKDNKREVMCTYNINLDLEKVSEGRVNSKTLPNTISIHRKKQTNTLYTINALNDIVSSLNNGVIDSNFIVEWDDYKNSLLVTDEDGLKIINTKLYTIIELN